MRGGSCRHRPSRGGKGRSTRSRRVGRHSSVAGVWPRTAIRARSSCGIGLPTCCLASRPSRCPRAASRHGRRATFLQFDASQLGRSGRIRLSCRFVSQNPWIHASNCRKVVWTPAPLPPMTAARKASCTFCDPWRHLAAIFSADPPECNSLLTSAKSWKTQGYGITMRLKHRDIRFKKWRTNELVTVHLKISVNHRINLRNTDLFLVNKHQRSYSCLSSKDGQAGRTRRKGCDYEGTRALWEGVRWLSHD